MQVQTKLRVLASDLAAEARTRAAWFDLFVLLLKAIAMASLTVVFATQAGDMVDVVADSAGAGGTPMHFTLSALAIVSPIAVLWGLLIVFFGRCRCDRKV